MAIKEHVTGQTVNLALLATINSDTTTAGEIFDTADFDGGVYFAMGITSFLGGTFTLKIEHGDDAALADAADVPADMLVYGTLPALAAATVEGDSLPREGVHSTKRYVRASIVSTGASEAGNDVFVICVRDSEYLPTDQV